MSARPSIADPFLPNKIDEGRIEDIRECIGCNICVTGDMTMSLSRCTQNSSFMEEWRKGWHPERIKAKSSGRKVLVVGAGPAGLSAAHKLGLRGYEVALAEAGTELGGRVARECRLPGLAAWGRVRDYRIGQTGKMTNVNVYRSSALTADDIMNGARPSGHVAIYDDDHYYMGGVLAELLIQNGNRVTYLTPLAKVSEWSSNTLEQALIQTRLLELGVDVRVTRAVTAVEAGSVMAACIYTGRTTRIDCDAVLMVTARLPDEQLYLDLKQQLAAWADHGIVSVKAIGDALPFRREVAGLKN